MRRGVVAATAVAYAASSASHATCRRCINLSFRRCSAISCRVLKSSSSPSKW